MDNVGQQLYSVYQEKYYIHLQGEFKTLRFINFQINNTKHFSSYEGSISKINIPIIQSLSLRHERENSE